MLHPRLHSVDREYDHVHAQACAGPRLQYMLKICVSYIQYAS